MCIGYAYMAKGMHMDVLVASTMTTSISGFILPAEYITAGRRYTYLVAKRMELQLLLVMVVDAKTHTLTSARLGPLSSKRAVKGAHVYSKIAAFSYGCSQHSWPPTAGERCPFGLSASRGATGGAAAGAAPLLLAKQ